MMRRYLVEDIEFDFDEDCSDEECQAVLDVTVGAVWEAEDENDLVEFITDTTGWCIRSIKCQEVL